MPPFPRAARQPSTLRQRPGRLDRSDLAAAQLDVMLDDLGDDGEDVRVVDSIDLAPTLGSGDDQVSEFELGQVLADRSNTGANAAGQGGDIEFIVR